MQPYRMTVRSVPRACSSRASCAAPASRNIWTTPFGHHHPFGVAYNYNPVAAEVNGLFRLLDNAANEIFSPAANKASLRRRTLNPRFDVREVDNTYELKGEVPGIAQADLQIEFEDEKTLVIRGKTTQEVTDSNVKAVANTGSEETTPKAVEDDDAASVHSDKSSNYKKASVEDEYVDAGAEASTDNTTTTTNEKADLAETKDSTPAAAPTESAEAQAYKYWVSERSVGEFERRFSFPGRVDQDAVTASLKNGILSVVVPKTVEKAGARKIEIQ